MVRIALRITFDGSEYKGWQVQPGQITVQNKIEEVLALLCGRHIQVTGCGRTDSGVHARNFILHLDASEEHLDRIRAQKLNGLLPEDISVDGCWIVGDEFHARFDCCRRKYIYRITTHKAPFRRQNHFLFHHATQLKMDYWDELCGHILSQTDFKSFSKSHSGLEHFICHIRECRWKIDPEAGVMEFHISANRFVRGMVRLMTGCFLNLGLGIHGIEEVRDAMASGRQPKKSWSVPAHGLTLEEVDYPAEITALWKPV